MYSNDLTRLISKIERQLGLIPLTPHLPKEYNKNAWAEVIKEDSITTFSRYFPHVVRYPVNKDTTVKKGPRYYINDECFGGAKILGMGDIDWSDFGKDNRSLSQVGPYGYFSPSYFGAMPATVDQAIGYQMSADISSMFNTGIYLEYFEPNMFEVRGVGNLEINLTSFVINVLVEHMDLNTISATKMEFFEKLAKADVANFLYKNLKYFDGLETVYAQVDLKLTDLQDEGSKRESILEEMENSYVSAANDSIPYILTI